MTKFIFFDPSERDRFLKKRAGETKLGEQLSLFSSFEALKKSPVQYVIIGIPEDIGIRANYGKPGAANTWASFLSAFLNIQSNVHNLPGKCTVLGQVDCREEMLRAENIMTQEQEPQPKLGLLVAEIDQKVTEVIQLIVSCGKTPIIIGGGHNNAYGNIKGCSLAAGKPVNILNIDAHTDLRHTDYRHSGNGFSYAKKEGFLNKYLMFGIHKNYTPQYIFDQFEKDENTVFRLYEDLMGGTITHLLNMLQESADFLDRDFGLEIDCDAIEHFASSAMTPSGFSVDEIRSFIQLLKRGRIRYLHLAEAAEPGDGQTGKALSYFVSDFIR